MKPITLDMRAFGPYAEHAEVDFEPLADVGLFVISGPTGAGKSTIFDAICFALYGSLSGARSGHTDVRSHYAEPAARCSVTLVFDAEGQRWRVSRQPAQTVQKVRGTGTTNQPATANLERWDGLDWQPDTTKVRDVTVRCRELVGLSLEQFERVVLLPQGRFAEVLNAKTSERSDLLRTLFGSEIFDRASEILAEQAKEGERSLKGVNEQRAVFHQRAVQAVENIEATLEQLPDDVAAALRAQALDAQPAQAQLSLLDAATDADDGSGDALDGDPSHDLDRLVAGPVARLVEIVEHRRTEAEAARLANERAVTQQRVMEQRAESLHSLTILEAQAEQMADVARRAAAARSVAGLDDAIAQRAARSEQQQDTQASMAALVEQILAIVPNVLPDVAPEDLESVVRSEAQLNSATISDLSNQAAARSAEIDQLAEQLQRLEHRRREHAEVAQRLEHLDSIEQGERERAEHVANELAALAGEAETLQPVADTKLTLVDKIEVLEHLLTVRADADRTAAELEQANAHRASTAAGVAAASEAIEQADIEIAELTALVDDLPRRRQLAEQAARRCQRRADLGTAMAELTRSVDLAKRARETSDATFASFVAQTAPRLATQLRTDEPCPVCGSAEHPMPAGGDVDDRSAPVDAATVAATAATASEADAEVSRWQAKVAGIIEEDTSLSSDDSEALEATRAATAAELELAEAAKRDRELLVAGRSQLQERAATAGQLLEDADANIARLQLSLSERQGALGDAAKRTAAELEHERTELVRRRQAADEAIERLSALVVRRGELIEATNDADRRSRQRAIDRATAAERLEQLATVILGAETQLNGAMGGASLPSMRTELDQLQGWLDRWQEESLVLAGIASALASSEASCRMLVSSAGFDDETSAVAASLPVPAIEQLEASHGRWSNEIAAHRTRLETLEIHDLPENAPDLDRLVAHALEAAERHRIVADVRSTVEHLVHGARTDLADVAALDATHARQREQFETLQRVASVVRGQNSRRLSLENWVLSVYLHDVVEHANLHLSTMSNGRYRLAVQDAPSSQVGQHGLDLVVDDAHTGRVRASMSLSGGETFQASLSLALGLADVVMLGRAGMHLDALFVDEGFGSLDAEAVDQAISVLDGLRSRGSMVGVITHVEALKSALPVAIDVQPRADLRGSTIRQVA